LIVDGGTGRVVSVMVPDTHKAILHYIQTIAKNRGVDQKTEVG
jgi:hypothetical protein